MCSAKFVKRCGPFSLSELEKISGAELYNCTPDVAAFMIDDLATLSDAGANHLSILHQKKYIKMFEQSFAGACIVSPEYVHYAPTRMKLLVHKNPHKAYALIAQVFYPSEKIEPYIADSACVSKNAILGKSCRIEHGAYIGKNVTIGARCKIGVNAYIGDGVIIGDDCLIENNVSISNTIMGNKVVVYPGARIGQDGFGFAVDKDGCYKIPHTGGVLIGNNVEIGANTCIDGGSLKSTVIEDWCRIDNLVQIGHNVKIGKGSIIVAQVGIAGSTELGEYVTICGQGGISGHLNIGSHSTILGGSSVIKDVAPGEKVGGYPAVPNREWHRQTITLQRLINGRNQ